MSTAARTDAGPGVERVGQIAVTVKDVDRAVAFYQDVLGLRLLFRAPPGLAFFDCGGVRLMLSVPEGAGGGASIIYYVVPDVQSACDALAARGVNVEHEPHMIARMPDHELWMAFIRDSEGNLVGLMEERRN
jgi:catechol 2,3-dioxygenase-like lactoylglutathione lyase family enzyme